jgi:hypothetical protein
VYPHGDVPVFENNDEFNFSPYGRDTATDPFGSTLNDDVSFIEALSTIDNDSFQINPYNNNNDGGSQFYRNNAGDLSAGLLNGAGKDKQNTNAAAVVPAYFKDDGERVSASYGPTLLQAADRQPLNVKSPPSSQAVRGGSKQSANPEWIELAAPDEEYVYPLFQDDRQQTSRSSPSDSIGHHTAPAPVSAYIVPPSTGQDYGLEGDGPTGSRFGGVSNVLQPYDKASSYGKGNGVGPNIKPALQVETYPAAQPSAHITDVYDHRQKRELIKSFKIIF